MADDTLKMQGSDAPTVTDPGFGLSIPGAMLVFVLIVVMFWVWWSFIALNKVQTYQVLYSAGDFSTNRPVAGAGAGARQTLPASGASFSTGSDGFATLQLSDGSTLQIMPNTQLDIVDAKTNAGGDRVLTILRMLSGELVSRIARGDGRDRDVNLYSNAVAIGVRGTVFSLQEEADKARLTVTQGKVEVTGRSGDGLLVKRNEGTVILAGLGPEPVTALLPEPLLQTPAVGAGAGPEGLSLSWAALPGALGYLIEIAEDSNFNRLLRRQQVAWSSGTLTLLERDGQYFWRVAAIDERGLRGRFSSARALTHDAYYLRSRAALSQLQVGAVLKNLDRARQGLDEEIEALRNQGFSQLNAGQFAGAKETFSVVLQLKPEDRLAQNGMGQANYQLLDYRAARSRYSDALGEGDAGADAEVGLALIDVREGKFARALARMEKIIQRDPGHQGALNVAAMAAVGLDRLDQASEFVRWSLALDGTDPTALDLQRTLTDSTWATLQLPASGKIAPPEELQRKLGK